jgi:probable rRNA maturation factor
MGIPGPTDVLTFPLEADAGGRVTGGEVVVCVPEARRRAREHRTRLEHELLLYALHGMLHLCGYDDRTQRAYAKMHRTEDQILKKLGIGPVFAAATTATTAEKPAPRRRKAPAAERSR